MLLTSSTTRLEFDDFIEKFTFSLTKPISSITSYEIGTYVPSYTLSEFNEILISLTAGN